LDLQASKKSKGLQEQQSHLYFNTLALHSLTISTSGFTLLTANFRINPRLLASAAANEYRQCLSASGLRVAGTVEQAAAAFGRHSGEAFNQFAGEKIQSKGRMRRSLVFDTFPCQPHLGLSQVISSSPKIFIASFSESAGLEHFRCKLILCPPLGHANTIL
jgi:hypothetical protein